MRIYLETENEETAAALANEILDDVCGKKVETWHHCLRPIKGVDSSCIYHYTDKDPNDDNKRIKFYVYEKDNKVGLKQTWRAGYTPGRQTKLHLTSTLIQMIFSRYPEKFSAIDIQW